MAASLPQLGAGSSISPEMLRMLADFFSGRADPSDPRFGAHNFTSYQGGGEGGMEVRANPGFYDPTSGLSYVRGGGSLADRAAYSAFRGVPGGDKYTLNGTPYSTYGADGSYQGDKTFHNVGSHFLDFLGVAVPVALSMGMGALAAPALMGGAAAGAGEVGAGGVAAGTGGGSLAGGAGLGAGGASLTGGIGTTAGLGYGVGTLPTLAGAGYGAGALGLDAAMAGVGGFAGAGALSGSGGTNVLGGGAGGDTLAEDFTMGGSGGDLPFTPSTGAQVSAMTGGGGSSILGGLASAAGSLFGGGGGAGGNGLGSLIAPAANIVGGLLTNHAAGEAADAMSGAFQSGIAENRRQFDLTRQLLQPYVDAGTGALGSYQDLSGARGPQAQQAAMAALEGSPQYASLVKQGENAILQNASATGGLRGGNTQGALFDKRTELLNGMVQQQLNRYSPLIAGGQASAAGVGAQGMAMGANNANLMGLSGASQAGGIVSGTSAITNTVGNLGGFFAANNAASLPAVNLRSGMNLGTGVPGALDFGGGVVPPGMGYSSGPRLF